VAEVDQPVDYSDMEQESLMRMLTVSFEEYVKVSKKVQAGYFWLWYQRIEDPGKMADVVAAHLSLKLSDLPEDTEYMSCQDPAEAGAGHPGQRARGAGMGTAHQQPGAQADGEKPKRILYSRADKKPSRKSGRKGRPGRRGGRAAAAHQKSQPAQGGLGPGHKGTGPFEQDAAYVAEAM
jgi:hypothetical protein